MAPTEAGSYGRGETTHTARSLVTVSGVESLNKVEIKPEGEFDGNNVILLWDYWTEASRPVPENMNGPNRMAPNSYDAWTLILDGGQHVSQLWQFLHRGAATTVTIADLSYHGANSANEAVPTVIRTIKLDNAIIVGMFDGSYKRVRMISRAVTITDIDHTFDGTDGQNKLAGRRVFSINVCSGKSTLA
jgi:hypothetical protein